MRTLRLLICLTFVLVTPVLFAQGPPPEVMRDEAEMESAHLRVPWVLAMAKHLQENGHDIDPGHMPRTFDELDRHLGPSGLPQTEREET